MNFFRPIKEWYVSHFIIITEDEAISKGLTPYRNVYGDYINYMSGWQRTCRSVWKHPDIDRYYRVDTLIK